MAYFITSHVYRVLCQIFLFYTKLWLHVICSVSRLLRHTRYEQWCWNSLFLFRHVSSILDLITSYKSINAGCKHETTWLIVTFRLSRTCKQERGSKERHDRPKLKDKTESYIYNVKLNIFYFFILHFFYIFVIVNYKYVKKSLQFWQFTISLGRLESNGFYNLTSTYILF